MNAMNIDENPDLVYDKVNAAWKQSSRILLGDEIGDLKEYEKWLSFFHEKHRSEKSMISGKNVVLAFDHYKSKTKYITMNELLTGKWKPEPLNINQLKDIDSILEGIKENFAYVGNIITGKSQDVANSTHIYNSMYVYNSRHIYDSKYIAYSERTNLAQYLFGVVWGGADISFTTFAYACGTKLKRAFNIIFTETNSDVYFTAGVYNSSEVMFSFGQWGQQFVIGNHKLPKDKYLSIKHKLLEDIRADLEKNKKIPHILEMIEDKKLSLEIPEEEYADLNKEYANEDNIRKHLSKEFQIIPKIVLGKNFEFENIRKGLIDRHVPQINKTTSMITGNKIDVPAPLVPVKHRVVEYELLKSVSSRSKSEKPELDWSNIKEELNKYFVFGSDNRVGKLVNIVDSVQRIDSQNVIGSTAAVWSKYVYDSWWPAQCEYVAGSSMLFFSKFVINGYSSEKITRGFEVDSSTDLSDAYYVHDCHGSKEIMFSAHVWGKQFVIGNAELPKDKYLEIKKGIMEDLRQRIENKKDVPDIFGII